jgi:hypothetical protein
MSRRIGLDRPLRLEWLDATIGLCQQGLDANVVAQRLHQRLENDIQGVEARSKTITVLMRIWIKVPDPCVSLRDEALRLAVQVPSDERLWLHWGMCLLAYPFFRDVAAIVGQLGRLQGAFSLAQVQRRMVEGWGQRTTLQRAVRRILRTLYDWAVIQEAEGRGNYVVAPTQQTQSHALGLWLLACTLKAHSSEQVPLQELCRAPYLFPFDLLPFVDDVRRSERFEVTRQGLDLEMVALCP